MRMWRNVLVLVGLAVLHPWIVQAEGDQAGGKDHPLLTRYPGSAIGETIRNYDSVEFAVGKAADGGPTRQTVEGDRTFLRYFYDEKNQPSPLQLIRNYQNAIKKIGGSVLYERLPKDSDGGETTLKVTTGGKEVWVKVEPDIFSAPTQSYKLDIVEAAAMEQAVEANKLLEELNRNGFVALYINFDTGKWDLKPDGQRDGEGNLRDAQERAGAEDQHRGPHRQRRRGGIEQDSLGESGQERDERDCDRRDRCQAPVGSGLRPGETGGGQPLGGGPGQKSPCRARQTLMR